MGSYLDLDRFNVTDHQRQQLEIATSSPIGCFTGAAGTGKTFCIGQIVTHFKGDVKIVTPTGKAASRVREIHLGASCSTVHSALEPNRAGKDGNGWSFNRNKSFPLDHDLIICEEWSMADASIHCDLLRAVKRGTKLLLVGDPFRQLPPVGRGKPFIDTIDAGVPHGSLTELHRFAGRIARVCGSIADGKPWMASTKLDLESVPKENFIHIESQSSRTATNLKSFVEQFQARGYSLDQIQVLCPCNTSGDLSREKLNTLMQRWFNSDSEEIVGRFDEGKEVKVRFRVGDKCMNLSNAMLQREPQPGETAEEAGLAYVANGDTGIVLGAVMFKGKTCVRAKMPTGIIVVELGDFRKDFTLAYAITGHKSQGSQWPVVIVIIDDSHGAGMVADRAWLYTSISRASEICCTVGAKATMNHWCRVNRINSRVTFLSQEIRRLNPAGMASVR